MTFLQIIALKLQKALMIWTRLFVNGKKVEVPWMERS